MTKKRIKYLPAFFGVALLVFLDQLTKWMAVAYLNPDLGGSDVVIWDGVFRLQYLENRGAAFGIMQGRKVILIAITLVMCGAICWIYRRIPFEKHFLPLRALAVFLMAGAIGNFIDRMRFGYVVDFLYFELIHFPIFNVADIYVTCSVVVFVVLFLFYYKEEDLNRIFLSVNRKAE